MRLSEYARGRDNNFTLIRLLAALTVVLYHSGPALGFRADGKSLFEFVGRSFGEMALDNAVRGERLSRTASLFNRGHLKPFPVGAGAPAPSGALAHAAAHRLPARPCAAGAAGALSWALAFCSWHLAEKRAMGLKDACAEATARVLRAARERIALPPRVAPRPPAESAVGSVARHPAWRQ